MSETLIKKITDYQKMMSSKETQDEYYGENGIYTRLCNAYDELAYYESSMMPNTDMVTDPGKAKEQYNKIVNELTADGSFVAVSSLNNYDDNLFVGVTNNVEAYAQVFLDSRFDLEIVRGTTSYSYDKDKKIGTWKGKIRITQHTDETNVYPVDVDNAPVLEIKVNEDVLEFAKQKVYKALSKASLADIDFDVAEMDETGIRAYFNQYSLNRLQSFSDAYNSCISILATLGQTTTSEVQNELYNTYERIYEIVESVKDERQKQVDEIKQKISDIQKEQKRFQEEFAIFVFENRTENTFGSKQHDYDVIYGVMSDSVPTQAILQYKMGIKTKEEVLDSLKKATSMKQLSLHNQNLCDIIKLKEAYTIDKITNKRKELNVDDYGKQRND